jgi:hypothetical protein
VGVCVEDGVIAGDVVPINGTDGAAVPIDEEIGATVFKSEGNRVGALVPETLGSREGPRVPTEN